MNKRIKELAEQAYRAEMLEENPAWKENEFTDLLLDELKVLFEKFAESILQECMAKVCEELDTSCSKDGKEILNERVLKHFGVEK